ncbi:MAG: ZPR1 zinc finger domain-containing protein [Euryarchaeota archaeon]|nr:ZPR1 zinc finger domain-containing protein [Euryarchaeota archaeon]
MPIDSPCPVCGKKTLVYRTAELEIPNFGKCLETTLICKSCGFRHSDLLMLETHEPMRYEMKIGKEEDLNAKVIRSTSGTISIPEIGAKLEPGPYSEAFITNVEGVLNRFVDILLQLLHTYPDKRDEILDVMRKIGHIRHGKMPATIIIDDPFGNSAIVGKSVKKRKLSEEEVKNLKTGEITIDLKDIQRSQSGSSSTK